LPGPVEDEIDRRSTTAADKDDGLIDDVCLVRPRFFEAMAVDARGRRPRRARLQREAVSERQPDEVLTSLADGVSLRSADFPPLRSVAPAE
jgi:hypothetical protein